MTNRVQGTPLVHSRLIDVLPLGLFSSKELSHGCSSALNQCYEQCRQTAAKQSGPCLERPSTAQAPQGLDRSPNGGLHWGPRGPLATKQAPKDSEPLPSLLRLFGCHLPISRLFLGPHGCIDLAPLIRIAEVFSQHPS